MGYELNRPILFNYSQEIKMKLPKVISRKNLPSKLPFTLTWLTILTIQIFDINKYSLGAWFSFLALCWVAASINIIYQEEVDLFKLDK